MLFQFLQSFLIITIPHNTIFCRAYKYDFPIRHPLSIYGKGVLTFCTYIVPYALVQYYPLMYLIGRHNDARAMLLPVIACVFIIPCYLFWKFGVRHYRSTGS